jgi:hypothetical protein
MSSCQPSIVFVTILNTPAGTRLAQPIPVDLGDTGDVKTHIAVCRDMSQVGYNTCTNYADTVILFDRRLDSI